MKILLDEMFAGLKEFFEVLGREVESVQDAGLQGARDKDIVIHAKDHGMLLMTHDSKSAELSELLGVKNLFISNAMIAELADRKIKEKYPESRRSKCFE